MTAILEPNYRPEALVPAVRGAIRIIDFLAASDHLLGISELARGLNMGKATVYRMVHTLAAAGYLRHDPETNKYQLGPRLVELGRVAASRAEHTHLERRRAS